MRQRQPIRMNHQVFHKEQIGDEKQTRLTLRIVKIYYYTNTKKKASCLTCEIAAHNVRDDLCWVRKRVKSKGAHRPQKSMIVIITIINLQLPSFYHRRRAESILAKALI